MEIGSLSRRHPLALAALVAALGIVLTDSGYLPNGFWLATAVLLLLGGLQFQGRKSLKLPLVMGLVLCLYGHRHEQLRSASWLHPARVHLEELAEDGQVAQAVIEARPCVVRKAAGEGVRVDWQTRIIRFRADGQVFEKPARLTSVLPPNEEVLRDGWWRVHGLVERLQPALNPGEFDGETFALRNGVVAQLRVASLKRLSGPSWRDWAMRFRQFADSLRARTQEQLGRGLEHEPRVSNAMQAMVLGSSDETDSEITELFRRSGTLHVFAVSGLHVGLIATIGWGLLRPLGWRRHRVVLVLIPLIFGYAYVTGWRPSAARAALMISMLLMSSLALKRASLVNSLGAAALLLWLADTQQLFHIGFQLSFGVLLAIALLVGPFMERLRPWTELDSFLPPPLATARQQGWVTVRRFFASLASVSLAAWLGSLPLMWYHFNTVTPAALGANAVLIPLAFLCLSAACVGLLLSWVGLGGLAGLVNQLGGGVAKIMLGGVAWFAEIPGGHLHAPWPPLRWTAPPIEIRLHALQNGGEAMLLSLSGCHWLFDCGNARSFERSVFPAMRHAGVNRIEGLVLSHADAAHSGAAEDVIQRFHPQRILFPMHEPWRLGGGSSKLRELLLGPGAAPPTGQRWMPVGAEAVVPLSPKGHFHPARLTVLHPNAQDVHALADDRGLVLLLELGRLRVLWTADAGFNTETALLKRGEDLRAHVLIRSSHGTDYQAGLGFLEAVSPVLIATTRDLTAVHSGTLTLRRHAARYQIQLLELPDCGSIRLWMKQSDDRQLMVETWHDGLRLQVPLDENLSQKNQSQKVE